ERELRATEAERRRQGEIDAVVASGQPFLRDREEVEDQREHDGDDREIVPGEPHGENAGDESHRRRGEDAEPEGRPEAEAELVDTDRDPVHAEAEIECLAEGEQPDIAVEQVHARGEERPDQDLGDQADPEAVDQRRNEPGHREHESREGDKQRALDGGAAGHRVSPLNRPCGRSSSTALISTSEAMRATVGSAKLWMTPSRKASSTAAAAVPGRLPSPPMITAMKQNGRMSTPPRKSTVVIGAATAPPKAASAKPIANVNT